MKKASGRLAGPRQSACGVWRGRYVLCATRQKHSGTGRRCGRLRSLLYLDRPASFGALSETMEYLT